MRSTLIISTWAQNLGTFSTSARILLIWKGSIKLVVGEYQGNYCKPSCTIRNHNIDYGKYIYLIYYAHIFHQQISFFLFNFFLNRVVLKAAVLGGVLDLPSLVAVSVYDTNHVHFSRCVATPLNGLRKHGKFITRNINGTWRSLLCLNVNNACNNNMKSVDLSDQLRDVYQVDHWMHK